MRLGSRVIGAAFAAMIHAGASGQCTSFFQVDRQWWETNAGTAIASGDLNADGRDDVVHAAADVVVIYFAQGGGALVRAGAWYLGHTPQALASADFNHDGLMDLVVGDYSPDRLWVLFGQGNGGFTVRGSIGSYSSVRAVACGDFNGDGIPDLVFNGVNIWAGPPNTAIVTMIGNGDGGFSPGPLLMIPESINSLAAADFNGDEKTDLACVTTVGQRILLGRGDGSFGTSLGFGVPRSGTAYGCAAADFNGDGRVDLAISQSTSISVLEGNGQGGFGASSTFEIGGTAFQLAAGDFDGDRRPDLAFRMPGQSRVAMLMNAGSVGLAVQPEPTRGCRSSSAGFSVVAAGSGPFTYRWRRDGVEIDPQSVPSAATATLVIDPVTIESAGLYDCLVSNACGRVRSRTVALTVCPGDFNCDGGIDGGDVVSFFESWEAGIVAADLNEDGGVDGADLSAFFDRWQEGC